MQLPPRAPGTVAWHDLTVPAAPSVAAFYRDVLAVEVDPVPMGDYADFNLLPRPGADPVAGVCHARGRNAGLPPVWLPYFIVDDLAQSLAACADLGGRLVAGPSRAGDGVYAVAEDPAGAAFALWADSVPAGSDVRPEAAADADPSAPVWMWGPGPDPAALIEEIVLAGLLVASGGEGSVDGAELRTIMESLKKRFRVVGADLQLEALARAIERFETASVAEVSEAVARLGQDLSPAGRAAVFADLRSVASADGLVHTMEQTLLRHIAAVWELPPPAAPAPP